MRDKKHRVANLFVLLLSFGFAALLYYFIRPLIVYAQADEIAGIVAFSAGLFLNTSYLIFNFGHLSHKDSKLNASTQIWFGVILIFASLLTLIMVGLMSIPLDTTLIWTAGLVLFMIYVGIDRFDIWLEKNVLHYK